MTKVRKKAVRFRFNLRKCVIGFEWQTFPCIFDLYIYPLPFVMIHIVFWDIDESETDQL